MMEQYTYIPEKLNQNFASYRASHFPLVETADVNQKVYQRLLTPDGFVTLADKFLSTDVREAGAMGLRQKQELQQDLAVCLESALAIEDGQCLSPGIHFPSYVRMVNVLDHEGGISGDRRALVIGALSVASVYDFAHVCGRLALAPVFADIEGVKTVEFARQNNIPFVLADGTALAFADGTMDVVMTHGLVGHLRKGDDTRRLFAEAKRVLTDGGALCMVEDASLSFGIQDELASLDMDVEYSEADEVSRRTVEIMYAAKAAEAILNENMRDDHSAHLIFARKN